MFLSTVPEAVHVGVTTFHESFVYVAKPQGVQQRSYQSYGKHQDGGNGIVKTLHQRIHDQHRKEQCASRHEHLHFGVASGLGQFLIQMDGDVVINCQLKNEGEHRS